VSEARQPSERRWHAFLLLLGLPFVLQLGAAPLFDVDEGAFAEASREMWTSGDFGHTTLNGADRFDKPVAVYWLQAAAMALLGPDEWAARLPSALCAWALCVAVARFARSQWGQEVGLWAGGILATSAGLLLIGRASTADALLNLCLGLSVLDLWRHLQSGDLRPLRRVAVWVGLGLLTKGPVAVLIPGAALVLWWIGGGGIVRARRTLGDAPSWALLLAVCGPWYLYAWIRHGHAFVEGFLLKHNVDRFSATLEGHGGGVLYYAVLLPLMWLPWSALLWPVLRRLPKQWSDDASRFFLLWVAFVLVFFSISGTKLPHYALYACVPLALLMARQAVHHGPWLRALIWLGLAGWSCLLALVPWLAPQWSLAIADPLYRALIAGSSVSAVHWFVVGAAGAVLMLLPLVRNTAFAIRALVAGGSTALMCVVAAWPWAGEALQGPVRRAALASSQHEGQAVQWNVHWPSVGFYREQPVPRREPQPGELAFVRMDRWSSPAGYEVLYRERGVGLVRRLDQARKDPP